MELAGTSTFSTREEDAITRSVPAPSSLQRTEEELWTYYELEKCLEFIKTHDNVALQFPDHLLQDAPNITLILNRLSKKESFILGDTSYGSCCVDEVGADHLGCGGIIHFGPSCLTEQRFVECVLIIIILTSRLPVLYVFGREEIDVTNCADKFMECFPDHQEHIIILYDVIYHHIIDSLTKELSSLYPNLITSQLIIPATPPVVGVVSKGMATNECGCVKCNCDSVRSELQNISINGSSNEEKEKEDCTSNYSIKKFGRCFNITRPLGDYKIFYIGGEGPALINFMLTYHDNQFYSYDPLKRESRKESTNVNQMLKKRYFLIQKAKEANTIGILVGTLGAVNYLPMIERLKTIIKNAGKKSYTVSVGKINPAKLANFMEIQLYVLVACPYCSLLDTQEYYRPIVTPFEMEVACLNSRPWTGDVIMSYQELLPGGAHYVLEKENISQDSPEFSFLTGNLLPIATEEKVDVADSKGVVPRGSTDLSLPYSGASYLQSRSWKGLERRLGETDEKDTVISEGRTGLPTGYTHEKEH